MTVITVWLMISGLVVGSLLVAHMLSLYRNLAAQGIPAPLLVTYQKTLGRLVPARSEPLHMLIGRSALLSWDLRWVASGNSLAEVTGVDSNSKEIKLRLATPIIISATDSLPEVQLVNISFQPKAGGRMAYGKCAVYGRLQPPVMEGLHATASVIIYPGDA